MTTVHMDDDDDVRMGRKPHPRYVVVLTWHGRRSHGCIPVDVWATMRGWPLADAWQNFLGLARQDGVRPSEIELLVVDMDVDPVAPIQAVPFRLH